MLCIIIIIIIDPLKKVVVTNTAVSMENHMCSRTDFITGEPPVDTVLWSEAENLQTYSFFISVKFP